eukprot:1563233-Pyramimonas_sp.AAC.1
MGVPGVPGRSQKAAEAPPGGHRSFMAPASQSGFRQENIGMGLETGPERPGEFCSRFRSEFRAAFWARNKD